MGYRGYREGGSAHLYRTFAERFFFELVERRHCQGFGAANAAIRLAAQARGAAAVADEIQMPGPKTLRRLPVWRR